jgi:hypothetical protein
LSLASILVAEAILEGFEGRVPSGMGSAIRGSPVPGWVTFGRIAFGSFFLFMVTPLA